MHSERSPQIEPEPMDTTADPDEPAPSELSFQPRQQPKHVPMKMPRPRSDKRPSFNRVVADWHLPEVVTENGLLLALIGLATVWVMAALILR